MLRPDELKSSASTTAHEPEVDRQQPKVACTQPKCGYRNNLNKQKEENTNPPLPPVAVSRSTPPAPKPMGGGGSFSPDFEKLWEAYPRKDAKDPAEKAFKQLLRSRQLPSLSELLAAIKRFMATTQWQKNNGRFIPYLSKFLKDRRWLDPLSGEEEAKNHKRIEAEQLALAHTREKEAAEARNREQKRRLRLIYDAFAERFGDEAKQANERIDNKNFGTWMFHYGKCQGPTAADVPDGNTLCIADFMTEYQRRRDAEAYYAAQQTPVAACDPHSHSDNRERKPMSCAEILRPDTFMARFFPSSQPLCAAF
jgi:hypothetical protein